MEILEFIKAVKKKRSVKLEENMKAKPFLKWAGGKTQLIEEIENVLPRDVVERPFTYIEPFVGSGAVLFWMVARFPNMTKIVINDINADLINTYLVVKNHVSSLIELLGDWEKTYHALEYDDDEKKKYYYKKRSDFNARSSDDVTQAALFIFLNRTCFNGLYRVNRKNEFNVPIGSYKKPRICDASNLMLVSEVLQQVHILQGDYTKTLAYADGNTFFYFDPPYKPLSNTSSFNSYAKDAFDDAEQIRLKEFCELLDKKGYKWILSNSDVKAKNPNDNFFDDLYADFQIFRVFARRNINARSDKRGLLTELLISNA